MKKAQRKQQVYDGSYDVVYRDGGWDVSGLGEFRSRSLGEAQDWISSRHKKVRAARRGSAPSGAVAFRIDVVVC